MAEEKTTTLLKIEDKLRAQERWMVLLMILAMAAVVWTLYEIDQVYRECEKVQNTLKKENLSVNSGSAHAY